jgi:hypothetical protein
MTQEQPVVSGVVLKGVRRSTPEELLALGVPVEDWHPELQEQYRQGGSP